MNYEGHQMSESEFCHLLGEYIRRRKVSRRDLGEAIGVGSIIFKYVNGTRPVPDLKTVEKMADYLQFSAYDKKQLIHFWRIDTYGQARLENWRQVSEFFRHFQADSIMTPTFSFKPASEERKETISFLYSDFDVQQAILSVLEEESHRNGGGEVSAVMSSDDRKLIECLYIAESHMKELHIHHILKLSAMSEDGKEREVPGGGKSISVLNLLQQTIPLYLKSPCYESRFFYSDNVHSERWPLSSNFLLSVRQAVIYGEGSRGLCGIYIKDPSLVRYLKGLSDEIYAESQPFLIRMMSPEDLLDESYANGAGREIRPYFSYTEQPCMCHYLKKHMIEAHVLGDAVPENLKNKFMQYLRIYRAQNNYITREYSYLSGISSFLKTGRFDGIPADLYTPLEMKERIAVIESWLESRDGLRTSFLREDNHRRVNLAVCIWKQVMSICFQENGETYMFLTQERDLINSFRDYLCSLDTDTLLTDEEAEKQIKKMLEKAKENL